MNKLNTERALLGFERLQQHAKSRGGKCHVIAYIGLPIKYLWECAHGHRWEALASNVLYRGTWCPECKKENIGKKLRFKNGLKLLHKLAKKIGAVCLSDTYLGVFGKYWWTCKSCDHTWQATAHRLKQCGSGCPKCAKVGKKDLNYLRFLAEKNGMTCLSNSYINMNTSYLFSCNTCKHEWWARATSMHRGTKCPKCAREREK